jgi:hypothetical protein
MALPSGGCLNEYPKAAGRNYNQEQQFRLPVKGSGGVDFRIHPVFPDDGGKSRCVSDLQSGFTAFFQRRELLSWCAR